jgi:hypothetical protein
VFRATLDTPQGWFMAALIPSTCARGAVTT